MKLSQQKIYVQKSEQRLVDFAPVFYRTFFIARSDLKRSLCRFLACLYDDVANEILELVQIERIIFWMKILLIIYHSCLIVIYPKTEFRPFDVCVG